ncbi:peptidoglycan DD-metalloendopeptidase family protein [bacterium LRH843]|nr:peptidoglycan DD-metalloendopeptidase family protein [bacterium LRH843]
MLDFIKRICIALALAAFIGMLFLGTKTTFAAEDDLPNELTQALIWPTVGEVTDTYGTRGGKHYGIDLAAPRGTPVVAVAEGEVSRSYYSDTYGQVVFVEHDNGLETVYAHLDQREVFEGQAVREGEVLGTVGNTGRSSGSHLHFEVHAGNWDQEKSHSIDPFIVLSNEPEFIYASLGDHSPYGQDWKKQTVTVMSREGEKKDESEQRMIQIPVQAGDTLWDIATDYHVAVEDVKKWNLLEEDFILPGEVLTVYPKTDVYIVKKGDTLSSIAHKHRVTIELIQNNNQLESDLIIPGQFLLIY